MIVRPLHPGSAEEIDLESAAGLARITGLYRVPKADWLRINLVTSVNGNAADENGTSDGLSNRIDRKILGVIRRAGDVVLVGAATVRAEGYLLPRTAALAVVSASGDLAGHAIPAGTEQGRVLVLCTRGGLGRASASLRGVRADIVVLPDVGGRIAPVDIVAGLRARGLRKIVCEGGPSLAGQLVDAGLVDELCLTTSPVLGATAMPMFGTTPLSERRTRLAGLLIDDSSALYARWSIEN